MAATLNRRNLPQRRGTPPGATRRRQVASHIQRVMHGKARPHPQFRFTLLRKQIGGKIVPALRVSSAAGKETHEFRLTPEQERKIVERWNKLKQPGKTSKVISRTLVRTVALNPDVIAHGLKEILLHL